MYYPCLALEKSTWVAMVTVNSPSVLPLSQDNSNMQKYVQSLKKAYLVNKYKLFPRPLEL